MREKGEHLVASKWRWDDSQKQMRPQKEVDWKEIQSPEVGDRREWLAVEKNSEDLKVSLRELREQLESREEADISFMQIAKQARKERGQKLFQIFRLKGLVVKKRRCQELMQEVEL